MHRMRRLAAIASASLALLLAAGCTTTSALITLVGVGTDTSVTWEVVKHLHAQLTEGDERPCALLNSAQRALATRCGPFVPGSIAPADIARTGYAECALILAARDPALWPALPEFLAKGARTETCTESPLVALARHDPCPDFTVASEGSLQALVALAMDDPRAVHHDAIRLLSCPSARAMGLDRVIAHWRASGALKPGTIGFSPLGALHPDALATSELAAALEADGHRARDALGGYQGTLAPGFEEALRTSHWAALEWWLARVPELVEGVPPTQGNQLKWLPLQRVLLPTFLARPDSQRDMVAFLLAHGASPRQTLPSNPGQSVLAFARVLKSPMLPLLDPAPAVLPAQERVAAALRRGGTSGE
jgi:hypothetical protein